MKVPAQTAINVHRLREALADGGTMGVAAAVITRVLSA
jgi:hypothetical protein